MPYIHNATNKPHEVLIVTAADYNGHRGCNSTPEHLPLFCGAWDGFPFKSPDEDLTLVYRWTVQAMMDKHLVDHARGGTDYAQWDLMVDGKLEKTARPGDYITHDGERCHIFTEAEFRSHFRKQDNEQQ